MILYLNASMEQGIQDIIDYNDFHEEFKKTVKSTANLKDIKVKNKVLQYDSSEQEELDDGWNDTKNFCNRFFSPILKNCLVDYKSRNLLLVFLIGSLNGLMIWYVSTEGFNRVKNSITKNGFLKERYTDNNKFQCQNTLLMYTNFKNVILLYQLCFYLILFLFLWVLTGERMISSNVTIFFALLSIISTFVIYFAQFKYSDEYIKLIEQEKKELEEQKLSKLEQSIQDNDKEQGKNKGKNNELKELQELQIKNYQEKLEIYKEKLQIYIDQINESKLKISQEQLEQIKVHQTKLKELQKSKLDQYQKKIINYKQQIVNYDKQLKTLQQDKIEIPDLDNLYPQEIIGEKKLPEKKEENIKNKSVPLIFVAGFILCLIWILSILIIHNKYVMVVSYFIVFIILLCFAKLMFNNRNEFLVSLGIKN